MKREALKLLRDYWPLALAYIVSLPFGFALGYWLFF